LHQLLTLGVFDRIKSPSLPFLDIQMKSPVTLYSFSLSGHSHRVRLMLSLLDLDVQMVEINLGKGEHKTPSFLALNPFGQVPVIDDEGHVVSDSNGILVYLAKKYGGGQWLPEDPAGAAAVQRWLSVAAGPLVNGPATARLIALFKANYPLEVTLIRAHSLLAQFEQALSRSDYLVNNAISIADIACYTYVALAPEGNVSLAAYPAVRAWLARIEALPGFTAMHANGPAGQAQ
jgi:glutathione S-transferase